MEGAGQRTERTDRILRKITLKLLIDGEIRIKHLKRLLREVAHLQAGAQTNIAGIRRQRPGNHLQQRALPGSIAAHNRPTLAAPHGQVEPFINHARTEALVQVFEHCHLIAGTGRSAELELNHLALFREFQLFDLIQGLDAALHLPCLCGVCLEAVDEALLFGQHRLLPGKSRLLVRLANGAFPLVEIVITGVGDDFTRIDFRDLRDDAVHELAIVRGHQQRARIVFQKLFQPNDGFQIQVVGRFIHQQNVGLAKQHARQGHTHFPTTGKRAHVAIDLIVFETQTVKHFARLCFESVAAKVFVLFLHMAEAVQNLVHLIGARGVFKRLLQAFQFVMQIARAAAAGDSFV